MRKFVHDGIFAQKEPSRKGRLWEYICGCSIGRRIAIKEDIGFSFLLRAPVDVRVQPADDKAGAQIEKARGGVVVLSDGVNAAVALRCGDFPGLSMSAFPTPFPRQLLDTFKSMRYMYRK